MTSQKPDPAAGERLVTYWLAQGGYRGIIQARERFDELTSRDHSARAIATLKARGTYDPAKHSASIHRVNSGRVWRVDAKGAP